MITVSEGLEISRQKLDTLWTSLLHRAFSGDLTVKWREARMNELLAEMEEQEKALKAVNLHAPYLFRYTKQNEKY